MMADGNPALTGQEEIRSDQILGQMDFSTLKYADVFPRLQIFPSGAQQSSDGFSFFNIKTGL